MEEPVVMNVPIKPAWESKVNWTIVIQFISTVLTLFGWAPIPPELVPQAILVINTVGSILAVVFRTWFTTSLTWPSALRLVGSAPPETVTRSAKKPVAKKKK